MKQQSRAGVTITPDLAYGADPRQKLDVLQPEGSAMPVLVYIPGGGFISGDKNTDGVFYSNLGVYFARHGYLTIIANYRLAPANRGPQARRSTADDEKDYGSDANNSPVCLIGGRHRMRRVIRSSIRRRASG